MDKTKELVQLTHTCTWTYIYTLPVLDSLNSCQVLSTMMYKGWNKASREAWWLTQSNEK